MLQKKEVSLLIKAGILLSTVWQPNCNFKKYDLKILNFGNLTYHFNSLFSNFTEASYIPPQKNVLQQTATRCGLP